MSIYKELAGWMRAGAAKRGHARDAMYWDGKTCALGAAMEGFGVDVVRMHDGPYHWADSPESIRQLDAITHFNLRMKEMPGDIIKKIVAMNDSGCFTREEIADWVEAQEGAVRWPDPYRQMNMLEAFYSEITFFGTQPAEARDAEKQEELELVCGP